MLKLRGKPDRKPLNDPQPFCGLISCASCGMIQLAEYKVKRQKNGNVHEYIYYHCTKKNKSVKCEEPMYSGRTIKSPVIISDSKKFLCPKTGRLNCQKLLRRTRKIRPVFDCLCEREAKEDFFISQKLEATS